MKNKNFALVYILIILSCNKNEEQINYSEADIPIIKTELLAGMNNIDTVNNELIIFNPYKNKGKLVLKGSMHNHTDNSLPVDGYGSGAPTATAIKFRDAGGFDFYTFTDHNYVTGDPQVQGIVWMGQSIEDTQSAHHLCVYNLPVDYEFIDKGDDINTQIRHYHSIGAFVSYAHPDWEAQIQSNDKILSVDDMDFVEIVNGQSGSERAFNLLLSKGTVFGFGVDDYHYNPAWENPDMYFNKGYIVAFADFKEKKSIWKALLSGCFYASSGASMDIKCENGLISVFTEQSSIIEFIGKNDLNPAEGKILKIADDGINTSYQITGNEGYIWVRLHNSNGRAYSQAFIIREP
jgi:hypothetical protein